MLVRLPRPGTVYGDLVALVGVALVAVGVWQAIEWVIAL